MIAVSDVIVAHRRVVMCRGERIAVVSSAA
jgi:hypothetical protein